MTSTFEHNAMPPCNRTPHNFKINRFVRCFAISPYKQLQTDSCKTSWIFRHKFPDHFMRYHLAAEKDTLTRQTILNPSTNDQDLGVLIQIDSIRCNDEALFSSVTNNSNLHSPLMSY